VTRTRTSGFESGGESPSTLPTGFGATSTPVERALSTTLDVTLCLLLCSAAVGVLAAAGPPPDRHDPATANAAADRLATTTVTVEYALSDASGDGPVARSGPDERRAEGAGRGARSVQGTTAALLARSAVADVAVGDAGNTDSASADGQFERAVVARTERVLAGVDARVNVTATYAPAPGSGVRGRTTVGPTAPPGVDVAVARVTVPVGSGPRPSERREAARDGGYRALAAVVAAATMATVAPPSRARWGLRDAATRPAVRDRYGRLGDALDVDVASALAGGRVGRANDLLASALADLFVAAFRDRHATTAAAANAADPRTVTITVRTWSP